MGGHKGGKRKGGKKKSGRPDGTTEKKAGGNRQRLPSVRQQLASHDPPCAVYEVDADGNCLFRSLHDQLVGVVPGLDHGLLRQALLDYIESNAAFYASYVEDDEKIDDYIARMREDGSWGGHIELHACARRYGANVTVFQADSPVWCIKEWPEDAMMLYVTYHDGNHYNSVRTKAGGIARSMVDGRAPMVQAAEVAEACELEVCGRAGSKEDESESPPSSPAPSIDSSALRKGNCHCGSGRKYRKCCKKRQNRRGDVEDGEELVSRVASLCLERIDI